MIRFSCTCGGELQAPDALAGREGQCPACNKVQIIPSGLATAASRELLPLEPPHLEPTMLEQVNKPVDRASATTSLLSASSLAFGIGSLACIFWGGRDALILASLAAIPATILGCMAFRAVVRPTGRMRGRGMAEAGPAAGISSLLVLIGIAGTPVDRVAPRTHSMNNLRQMSLAMIIYCLNNNAFPAAAGGKDLHPGLSWRVAILPYVEEDQLYNRFHLDEPWDSPHNEKLLTQMPKLYKMPGTNDGPGLTRYRVFVGKWAAFEKLDPGGPAPAGRKLGDFHGGIAKTILVAEAAEAVPWTKPDELIYDPDLPLPPLSVRSGGFQVTMGDFSVHSLNPKTSEAELRALIDIDDDKPRQVSK
jgi:hypothetical protein